MIFVFDWCNLEETFVPRFISLVIRPIVSAVSLFILEAFNFCALLFHLFLFASIQFSSDSSGDWVKLFPVFSVFLFCYVSFVFHEFLDDVTFLTSLSNKRSLKGT